MAGSGQKYDPRELRIYVNDIHAFDARLQLCLC